MNILNSKVKVVTPQLQNHSSFTTIEDSFIPDAGGYLVIPKDEYISLTKSFLAIFNSKLFYFFIKNTSTPFNNEYYYFKTDYIMPFCIPNISTKINETLSKLVNEHIVKSNEQIETKIDQIVFKLYNLSYDEVLVVDPAFPLSKEEYENYEIN